MEIFNIFYLLFQLFHLSVSSTENTVVYSEFPRGCDIEAAQQCEYDLLNCRLLTGPADDPATLCRCGGVFYGSCLRMAGCETYNQVGALTKHEVYVKTCVDLITKYDCPSTLMCSMNCASDTVIDTATTKIIPFNNYGQYYLRIRICVNKVHELQKKRYSMVNTVPCKELSDFLICSRWIPPQTFVPVALPIDTTYIEVDNCQYINGEPHCDTKNPARVYGNKFLFPRSFDVAQSNVSVCSSDADCLGSYCDFHFFPSVCSPKTMKHVLNSGKYYLSTPFG